MDWIQIVQDTVQYGSFVNMLTNQCAPQKYDISSLDGKVSTFEKASVRWNTPDSQLEPSVFMDFMVHYFIPVDLVLFLSDTANCVRGNITVRRSAKQNEGVQFFRGLKFVNTKRLMAESLNKEQRRWSVTQLPYTINIRRNDRQMSSPSEIHFH